MYYKKKGKAVEIQSKYDKIVVYNLLDMQVYFTVSIKVIVCPEKKLQLPKTPQLPSIRSGKTEALL